MALPKYQKQYLQMLELHKDTLDEMKAKSKKPKSEEFREIQLKAIRIVRKNEDMLCAKTENARFANFSGGLADKFWELVRIDYPEIDLSTE